MIRRYMPVDNKNPKREWPCRALSGEMVMVKCGIITHTTEDLTSWVKSGLLCEFPPVTATPAQPIAPPAPAPAPARIQTTSDAIAGAFSDALSGLFQKAAPPVALEPVAPAPVAAPLAPVAPPVVAEAVADEPVDDTVDASDLTEYGTMKRAALWSLVVERGLDSGREYRSLTKGDLIYILGGGTDVA
jgi:hypothetical protein